ncbi:unnamed protein product [Schistosoma rodhaini]|uniref:Protein TIC 214 n=2 Tax=Schistosoma rodhaini TaxID=6188 RepID=A0AA85GJA5_9TREM|nr:unnamed protein product [Schistosoma rodhaini]
MITETLKEEDVDSFECSKTLSEEKISMEDNTDDDDDNDYKLALEKLWGKEIANYYLNPNHQKSIKQSNDKYYLIGGYPNGMLHGSRIPFNYELKPWLLNIPHSNMKQSGSSKVPNIIDLLKYHIGTNYSAQYLWNLLRYKSYEQLINYEKQLSHEDYNTYASFTYEYVLSKKQKPPLCDFIRHNPSNSLIHIMKQLKSSSIKKKLHQMNLSTLWANRNQDQFRILSYQQDLKDTIKTMATNNFYSSSSSLLNNQMNQKQVNELISLYPILKDKHNETFIDNDLQPLENYFPDYPEIKDSIKKEFKLPNVKTMKKRATKSLDHLSFWHANQSIKSPNKTDIKYQSINNKQEKLSYQPKSPREQFDLSISNSSNHKKLKPLCWSDLFENNKQKDYSKFNELFTSLPSDNSRSQSIYPSFVKKTLWKPSKAIVS